MPLIVDRDIRHTQAYQDVEHMVAKLWQSGAGPICDAADIHASPDGLHAVFSGTLKETSLSSPQTHICICDLSSGAIDILTSGPGNHMSPKFSPDGTMIAFLSDRHENGDFQLYLLDRSSSDILAASALDGWVEYLHWSPDGQKILLGMAGFGADLSSAQGATTSRRAKSDFPSWIPEIDSGTETDRFRSAWIYVVKTRQIERSGPADCNIWEAVWCGNTTLAAIVSPGASESLWYRATLIAIEIGNGAVRDLYTPGDQLGWPAAAPSGNRLAFVEAICSDRMIVAGDLKLVDLETGHIKLVATCQVDVTHIEWRSDELLLFVGLRGPDTFVGRYDVRTENVTEIWSSATLSTAGMYPKISGFGDNANFALIAEGFLQAPEIAVVEQGHYRTAALLQTADCLPAGLTAEPVEWAAPDGLVIEGWVVRPSGRGPFPLIMYVHGGPVYRSRPSWLGRSTIPLMLADKGYAAFFPNPRGSSGKGQEFARLVVGDLGGADTYDYLSGLDYLVEQGIADPGRLGVTGRSYGGFMTSWLITQDSRFAAAVTVSPHTNHVSQHLVSNIPYFMSLFLADHYTNPNGRYFERSPIMHAHEAKTPTLNICGALDRCTPPGEAIQFHNALLENNAISVLITYPEEGHGVRKYPAVIDYAARTIDWFETHLATD